MPVTSSVNRLFTRSMEESSWHRMKAPISQTLLAKTALDVFCRTTGESQPSRNYLDQLPYADSCCLLRTYRLLTVGRTVDEAAFLFSSLDHACHSQLMADAAAANGVPKKIIDDNVAQYTAEAVQNPVSDLLPPSCYYLQPVDCL